MKDAPQSNANLSMWVKSELVSPNQSHFNLILTLLMLNIQDICTLSDIVIKQWITSNILTSLFVAQFWLNFQNMISINFSLWFQIQMYGVRAWTWPWRCVTMRKLVSKSIGDTGSERVHMFEFWEVQFVFCIVFTKFVRGKKMATILYTVSACPVAKI